MNFMNKINDLFPFGSFHLTDLEVKALKGFEATSLKL